MNKLIYLLLLSSMVLPTYADLYRWVDDSGKVHYSDKVPQAMSQKGHSILNENGTKKEEVISAKKRKEINLAKSLMKSKEVELKEKAKKQALADLRDTKLLSMYTTTDELKKVYASKFEMTDESISLLKVRHKFQTIKLDKLERQFERMKNPQSKEVMGKNIDTLLDNLKIYQQAITENYVEKEKLKKEYKENLERFSELLTLRQTNKK